MKQLAVIAVLTLATGAQAQVYRCQDGGRTVFSDQPCYEGASPIQVRPATGSADPTQDPGEAGSAVEASRRLVEQADIAARRRIMGDEIVRKEQRIRTLDFEMQSRLAQLQDKKRYAANNLAGATWEQSISEEMSAVTASYNAQIQGLRDEISTLRRQRDELGR